MMSRKPEFSIEEVEAMTSEERAEHARSRLVPFESLPVETQEEIRALARRHVEAREAAAAR